MTDLSIPAPRLTLVRHGRSAHVETGWLDAEGFRAWRAAYEAAGIRDGERPPDALCAWTERADLVVASDAPRAIQSARLLAPGRDVTLSPLLRELDLPGPDLGRLRLPLGAWAVGVGVKLLLAKLEGRRRPAAETARLAEAAAWLDDLAGRHARIVAVTHASIRGRLTALLARTGWRLEPGRRSLRAWSSWHLERHLERHLEQARADPR